MQTFQKGWRLEGDKAIGPIRRCPVSSLAGWLLLALGHAVLVANLHAHPISMTSALANVTRQQVEVEIDVMVEDLVLYYNLEPDEDHRFPRSALIEKAKEHRSFLLEAFTVRDRQGRRLKGEVVDLDTSEIGDQGVHVYDLMAHSMVYTLEFPLAEPPEYLTFVQEFGGENASIPAIMELQVLREGARLEPPVRINQGSAHTVALDWGTQLGSSDDLEAARQRFDEQKEDQLGITSYSSVYSYLYITETEVRHEMLIPLLTLESWIPLDREDPDFMTVPEQEAARSTILDFLKQHNRVTIDGIQVEPILDRLEFYGPDSSDLAREAPARRVGVYNTRVGVILSFPTKGPPDHLEIEWDFFDSQLPFLKSTAYIFEDESQPVFFNPSATTFEWENDRDRQPTRLATLAPPEPPPKLAIPVWSLAAVLGSALSLLAALLSRRRRVRLVGLGVTGLMLAVAVVAYPHTLAIPHPLQSQPPMSRERAETIFKTLHQNLYRAFDYHEEASIYDALAQSVGGDLLDDLYLQIRKGLEMEEQGGAISRVQEIEHVEGTFEPAEGSDNAYRAYQYDCTWTVTGTVEHWGHIHTRRNQYRAVFTIEGGPTGWKITDFEPLHEERLQFKTGLRS